MFTTSFKRRILLSFNVLLAMAPSFITASPMIEQWKKIPSSSSFKYEVVDLGETGIPPAKLTKYALPLSFAPDINNLGQISGNRTDEGFVKDLNYGEMTPRISHITSHCFGINNSGDLLLSFYRTPTDIEWWIWNQKNLRKQQTNRIDLGDLAGKNLFLRAINDSKIAVGAFIPTGVLRPIIWTPKEGLHHLGYYLGWDIPGAAWGVNNKGTVIGYLDNGEDNPPFVWNSASGLEVLKNYRYSYEVQQKRDFQGPIHFADMVIADNNLVYGNFWVDDPTEDPSKRYYYSYRWDPASKVIRPLNINGMRINAINSENTLAGSLDGQAAICDQGDKPVALRDLPGGDAPDWEFVDASAINDHGDIVGWGRYQGRIHLFWFKKAGRVIKQ